jgi:hypothetical protein
MDDNMNDSTDEEAERRAKQREQAVLNQWGKSVRPRAQCLHLDFWQVSN